MILQGKAAHPVREIILHCAAIKTGQFAHMTPFHVFATVNQWHTERGFKNGFGYHGLIMPDGVYYSGRPYSMIGAHCIGHNAGTLGFLLIESREITKIDYFSTYYTPAQNRALLDLVGSIDGIEKVSAHHDYAPKLCPGFEVKTYDWL